MSISENTLIIPASNDAPPIVGKHIALCKHNGTQWDLFTWDPETVQLHFGAPCGSTGKDLWRDLEGSVYNLLNINFKLLLDYQDRIPKCWRLSPHNRKPSFIGFWGSLYLVPGSRFGSRDNVVFGIQWKPSFFPQLTGTEGKWVFQYKRMASRVNEHEAFAYITP